MRNQFISTFSIRLAIGLSCLAISAALAADADKSQAVDPAAYDHPVRVACVGDSITMGEGTQDKATQGYPAQLQTMLGARWEVKTFAAGGRTLLRKQDPMDYHRAMKSNPDVVVILLGTNDARQATWDKHGKEFVGDYEGIVKDFQGVSTHPKVWLCLPPPANNDRWGINETIMANNVIPAIQEAATTASVPTIDLHTPLQDKKAWFKDGVHPNQDGAKLIAELVAAAINKSAATTEPAATRPSPAAP